MSMTHLVEQYEKQLNIVNRQIKEAEQADNFNWRKYEQLKQIKSELQNNICQMKKYIKKG